MKLNSQLNLESRFKIQYFIFMITSFIFFHIQGPGTYVDSLTLIPTQAKRILTNLETALGDCQEARLLSKRLDICKSSQALTDGAQAGKLHQQKDLPQSLVLLKDYCNEFPSDLKSAITLGVTLLDLDELASKSLPNESHGEELATCL